MKFPLPYNFTITIIKNISIIIIINIISTVYSISVDITKINDVPISNPACLGLDIENDIIFSPGFKSSQFYEFNEDNDEIINLNNFYIPGEMIYMTVIDENYIYALTNNNFGYNRLLYKINKNSEGSASIVDSISINGIFHQLYQSNNYIFVYSIGSKLLIDKDNFEIIIEFPYNGYDYIALINDNIVVSMDNQLLSFHDISNLDNIFMLSSIGVETSGNYMIKLFNNKIVYANNGMIYLIDISDIMNPSVQCSYYLNDTLYLDATLSLDNLIITTIQNMYIFEINNELILTESIFQPNFPRALATNNQLLFTSFTSGDFKAYDINTTTNDLIFSNVYGAISSLSICGNYLYAGLRDASNSGILVYDVSDFNFPIFIDNYLNNYKNVSRLKSTEHFLSFKSQNSSVILKNDEIDSIPLDETDSKIMNLVENENTLLAFNSMPNILRKYFIANDETLSLIDQENIDFPQNSLLVDAYCINDNYLVLGSVGEIMLLNHDLEMLDYYYNTNLPPFSIMDYDSGSTIHNDNLYICLLDQIAIFNINDNSIEFNQCIETNNKYYANSLTIKDDLLFIGHWGYFEIFDISDSNNPEFIDELYIDHGATCLAFNSDRTKFISSGGAYLSNYNLSIEYVSNSNDSICNDSIIRNYPNPFNPNTTFVFFLNQDNFIDISIYNTKGQLVKTLINKYQTSGFHNITWDGKDDFHKNVSSGIYFYKLKIDTKITEIGKCILLR